VPHRIQQIGRTSQHFMAKMNAKFMPMMLPFSLNPPLGLSRALLAFAALCALPGAPALAEKADRSQPLSFAADAARVDDNQRLNILSGNVEITKGSMLVRAERVEVRQNADGTQTATATGGAGGRSFFKQKRDGVDESIEGEAEKVVYEGRDDTVHFSGRAVMRRLKGVAATDEVTGQAIIYDNKTAVFQVVGASGNTTTTKGRVRGVITPRASEPAPPGKVDKASLTPAATLSSPLEAGR
jgi:lipopolysaccharide export system protein LptA